MSAPEPLREELSSRVRTAQAEWRSPSVAAGVVRGGELVWSDAVGLADVEGGEEATADHQYRVGSITKTFTAVALMQLRDAGELDLDDPLDRHLEGAAHAPTLRRMLAHLSGLQREPVGDVWETLKFASAEELVSGLGEAEQVLAPGTRWHYSNLAFALLGEVVTRRSGTPYVRYVEERILRPLGLERTSFGASPPVARGYFVEPYFDGVRRENDVDIGSTAPAGQIWSTVSDLCRWAAFFGVPDPAVLAPATVEEMRMFHALADPVAWTLAWGLGLELFRDGERILAGHGGGMPGFLSTFAVAPADRVGAAVVANTSAGAKVSDLTLELVRVAAEALPAPPEAWRPGEPPPPELEGVLGRWWSEGHEFVFSFRGGKLLASIPGAPPRVEPSVFEREGEDRYRVVSGNEHGELLRIVRDGDGAVTRLYLATYPFTRSAEIFGA